MDGWVGGWVGGDNAKNGGVKGVLGVLWETGNNEGRER
jgi:hypothetical protein